MAHRQFANAVLKQAMFNFEFAKISSSHSIFLVCLALLFDSKFLFTAPLQDEPICPSTPCSDVRDFSFLPFLVLKCCVLASS